MPPTEPLILLGAWLMDAFLGDPPALARFHPVVLMGRLITLLEKLLRRDNASPAASFAMGGLLWLLVVGLSTAVALALVIAAAKLGEGWYLGTCILLGWTTIATGDLARQVLGVTRLAHENNFPEARRALSMIVGRDTANLNAAEIHRAAFETGAENSSDGIVAPLCYLALGLALGVGPTLAIAYKAVNTLDSMVGYKNPRYLYFGRFSARADDIANLLPARLTALLTALAAALLYRTGFRTLKTVLSDHGHHSSPNSGYPEAAFAGALGVRIGGDNYYGGVKRSSHLIGVRFPPADHGAVQRCVTLIWTLSLMNSVILAGILAIIVGNPI